MKNIIRSASERDRFLGKWLWLLFLMFIPGLIAAMMASGAVEESFPPVYTAGEILNFVITAASAWIMLMLSRESGCYRNAAMANVISAAASLSLLVTGDYMGEDMTMTMSAAVLLVLLYGTYQEYMGHADVTGGEFPQLSEMWNRLWKWTFVSYAVMLGSSLLVIVSPLIALLVMMVSGLLSLYVGIRKIVLLYQTAQAFRKKAG